MNNEIEKLKKSVDDKLPLDNRERLRKVADRAYNEAITDVIKILNKHFVSQRSELLIDFLIHLNDKGLINNHDFDYEKEAKKYYKKLINCG